MFCFFLADESFLLSGRINTFLINGIFSTQKNMVRDLRDTNHVSNSIVLGAEII